MLYIFDAAFAAFLILAAVQDIRRREVEHRTIIGMLLIALTRMLYYRDYGVLYALIPIAIMIAIWHIKPEACGASDIKMLGCFFLYTGLALTPLFFMALACLIAFVAMLTFKQKTTPFCAWMGGFGVAMLILKHLW